MNIPLLDPPKSRRPRCATALILFGLCTTMSLLWGQPQQEETITNGLPVVREAIPVKYLTVTTRRFVIKDRCGFMETSTQQMPLMELFDELGEREDWAESEASSEQEQEVHFLHYEKEFAEKYGLTLKQVGEIKRDGYQAKQETRR